MEREAIKNELLIILEQQTTVEKQAITEESLFVDDLGADSLDLVEIIMECEDAFKVKIPDEKAETIKSVKDAIDVIHDSIN
jgi:acyl carrier protein